MIIKQVEISTRFGGVIFEAPYENIKPSFEDRILIDLDENDNEDEIRKRYRNLLMEEQIRSFEMLKNKFKADLVKKQYQKISFSEKDGLQYPHVTSITGWDKDFHISDIDLQQYASRGTIIHYMIEQFISTGVWLDLRAVAENGYNQDATIMFRGGLKLRVEDCSHVEFFEAFGKDFEFDEMEMTIWNDEYRYCGRLDAIGKYKGLKSIIDFKTGSSWDMKQLAAYANGDGIEGIEQLVICPVGPNTNKSGVKNPVVTKNIRGPFDEFLKDRAEFTKRFGV